MELFLYFCQMNYNLLCILGATATGKTTLAVAFAQRYGGEIISADSRQVYTGMDIGTGKDLEEYADVPYHLVDILSAGAKYNLFDFTQDFTEAYHKVIDNNHIPIMCGGSGLYLEAILNNYEMKAVRPDNDLRLQLEQKTQEELVQMLRSYKTLHNTTDTSTKKRTIRALEIAIHSQEKDIVTQSSVALSPLVVGIQFDVSQRRQRITERLHSRLQEGMVQEVENLLNKNISPDDLIYYGLEYKYITYFLTGVLSYDEMVEQLNTAIHRFAKRQMTWFRRMERKGTNIHWLDGNMPLEEKVSLVQQLWR